jgi:hypothetical protein
MKNIRLTNLGRFGNRMFRAAKALALAEQTGAELRMEPWEGEAIFTFDGKTFNRPFGDEDAAIDGYCQSQDDLTYSRADCLRWFKLKPQIAARVRGYALTGSGSDFVHCHRRVGDYRYLNYPIVSKNSYRDACQKFGYDLGQIEWVAEENPFSDPYFDGFASFMPDFLRMMHAPVLFRANSSLSWWAHTISPIDQRVFSPVITGLAGGVEHDNVPFIEGNSARLAELPGITELHLREQ